MKKISRTESEKQINDFFKDTENKSARDVKKIKRLAMSCNIPIRKLRKKFCKKCFTLYKNPRIRVSNKLKTIKCENCGYISRWKIKN